jgi:hypothetical protein
VLDRVKELAPQHPEWKTTEPFASLLKGDLKSALAGGDHCVCGIGSGLLVIIIINHCRDTSYINRL